MTPTDENDPTVQLFRAIYAAVEDLTTSLKWTRKLHVTESDAEALRLHRQSAQDSIDRLVKWAVLAGRTTVNSDYFEGLLDLVGEAEHYHIMEVGT